MLVLTDSLRIEGATVYRDASIEDGARVYTSVFYVLVDAPRIAFDEDGAPAFRFLWYRAPPPPPPGVTGGGFVTLTLLLSLPEEQTSAAREAIATATGIDPAEVTLRSMPWTSATLTLAFGGESGSGDGDLVKNVGGATTVAIGGRQRVSFSAELSEGGAALLAASLDLEKPLFFLRCDLAFEHRLAGATLRIFCDAKRSLTLAATHARAGALDAATLRRTLVDEHAAGVEITSEIELPPEQLRSLEQTGLSILESMLASVLLEQAPAGESSAPSLKPYEERFEASLNVTLSGSHPLLSHATLEGPVSIPLTAETRAALVTRVDLEGSSFPVHEVQILCAAELGSDLIDAVSVQIDYDETGPRGRLQRSGNVLFKRGSPTTATFRTDLAAPDKRVCRFTASVYYEGDPEPLQLVLPPTDSRLVVLDVDALGVLTLGIALRDVPFDQVRSVVVELVYEPRERMPITPVFVLDERHPEARAQIAVRDAPLSPYRYQVTYHLRDEERVVSPFQASTSPRLWLDLPGQIHRKLRVDLIAAGDFSALASAIVELREHADAPIREIVLTETGQRKTVGMPAAELSSLRYQVRQTFVYRDGVRKTLEWADDSRTVLIVRDVLRFSVRVLPRLLELGGDSGFALLRLSHESPEGEKQQTTLVLRSPSEEPIWSFRLTTPDAHRFRYMLTLVRRDGSRREGPLLEAEEEILVLVPPDT